YCTADHLDLRSFPTRRSSDLELEESIFEEVLSLAPFGVGFEKPIFKIEEARVVSVKEFGKAKNHLEVVIEAKGGMPMPAIGFFIDRKSTRLNSSHVKISYAVF